MSIAHLNLYTDSKTYNRMKRIKKHIAEKTGNKTWESVLLFALEYWEDHENKTENLEDKTDVEKI
jgi:hypothetical protein